MPDAYRNGEYYDEVEQGRHTVGHGVQCSKFRRLDRTSSGRSYRRWRRGLPGSAGLGGSSDDDGCATDWMLEAIQDGFGGEEKVLMIMIQTCIRTIRGLEYDGTLHI